MLATCLPIFGVLFKKFNSRLSQPVCLHCLFSSIILILFGVQIRSLEYVKQKGASGNKELAAMALKMKLQTRT